MATKPKKVKDETEKAQVWRQRYDIAIDGEVTQGKVDTL